MKRCGREHSSKRKRTHVRCVPGSHHLREGFMKTRVLIMLAATAGTLLLAGAASADGARSDVTLTFTDNEPIGGIAIPVINPDDPDTFSGAVSSKVKDCLANRTVTVYK